MKHNTVPGVWVNIHMNNKNYVGAEETHAQYNRNTNINDQTNALNESKSVTIERIIEVECMQFGWED